MDERSLKLCRPLTLYPELGEMLAFAPFQGRINDVWVRAVWPAEPMSLMTLAIAIVWLILGVP